MKLTYRPEIDGLRAIAVGAVILYHAQISIFGHQPFKGGFIGVDIFFVISGYLITSIILKELVTTGSFSFKHFYERRIRRILPALLFVMLVSLPFAWMYLLPSNLIDFSKSILYSLGFSSNFYFWHTGQQYGAESGLLKPFLHTWSLSVEEQYYILFPIVLLITFKYFRKYLIHTLIIGFIISLGLAEWGSRNHPSFNFYVLPTRVWELLAGSILSYFEIINGHRSQNQKLNLILPFIGLILIGHSIIFFNDEMYHPSFYTLSPIIGVCLIIWFSNKNEIITKLLSSKLFVGIGLISYSLYLWHYPVFAFARDTYFFDGSINKNLIIGFLIIILSIFSYYFIEKKFRNKNNSFNTIIIVITFCIFLIVGFGSNVIKKNGYDSYFKTLALKNPWKGIKCLENIDGCVFENNSKQSKKNIFLIGDSHMASLADDLKEQLKLLNMIQNNDFNHKFNTYLIGSCIYYPGFSRLDYENKINTRCNNIYFQKLKNILNNERNSLIIFGGRFTVDFTGEYFDNQEGGVESLEYKQNFFSHGQYNSIIDSFKSEVSILSKNNKIVLIYPIPEVGWHVAQKAWTQRNNKILRDFNIKKINNPITTSYQVYLKRNKLAFQTLDSIKGKNIFRVYPHKLFCDKLIKNRCITHDDKNIFYFDDDHPSKLGAKMINDLIMKEIEKIELKSN